MRERFLGIYTAALADILDARGLHEQTLPPSIRPLQPGTRLAGPAFTVSGRAVHPESYDAALRKVLAMLGDVPAGCVAVYACGQERAAHLGELSVTSLKARGVAGCVLDGGCRDVRFILEEGFPVFCGHVTPEDSTWPGSSRQRRCRSRWHRADRAWRLGGRRRRRRGRRASRARRERSRGGRGQGGDGERDPRCCSRRSVATRGVRALRHVLSRRTLTTSCGVRLQPDPEPAEESVKPCGQASPWIGAGSVKPWGQASV